MKKSYLTALVMFLAAFFLLFSFQKNKNKINSSGKKIYTSDAGKSDVRPQKLSAFAGEKPPENNIDSQPAQEATNNETLESFFKEMPRTSELQQASASELHGTPQAVLKAGEKLADIHEYFFQHPQPRDVEMSFYLKCSQQKDFFDSVRAVCAARLSQQYFEATGHRISAELFDRNIDQLRREINL